MKPIQLFKCPTCKAEYFNEQDAIDCINSDELPVVNVGDIVEIKYGFGWFDGDKRWVINIDVDTSKHGFGKDCSMGFYYVVTHIEIVNHRVKYHVYTNAMTGNKGYQCGYTYNTGHYTPIPIEAPDFVKEDSKKFIGKKAEYLV